MEISLNLPLINSEIELDLSWSKDCIISELYKTPKITANPPTPTKWKSQVLYTFTPNICYAYLLNVEPSNLVFLETYNTEFDDIIITFADQERRQT